jgi:hypothetical protein
MARIADISEVLLNLTNEPIELSGQERAVVDFALTRAEGAIVRFLGYDPVQDERIQLYPNRDFSPAYAQHGIWDLNEAKTHAVLTSRSQLTTSDLQVQHIPIRSIANLWVNIDGKATSARFTSDHLKAQAAAGNSGDYWPNNDTIDDDGNDVCLDGVIKSHGLWPLQPGTIRVQYTAGYLSDELHGQGTILNARPILDAMINETIRRAKKAFLNRQQTTGGWTPGSIISERLGDYNYTVGGSSSAVDAAYGGAADLLPESVQMLADFVNWGWRLAS